MENFIESDKERMRIIIEMNVTKEFNDFTCFRKLSSEKKLEIYNKFVNAVQKLAASSDGMWTTLNDTKNVVVKDFYSKIDKFYTFICSEHDYNPTLKFLCSLFYIHHELCEKFERILFYADKFLNFMKKELIQNNDKSVINADSMFCVEEYVLLMNSKDLKNEAFKNIEPLLFQDKPNATGSYFEATEVFNIKARLYAFYEMYSDALKVMKKIKIRSTGRDLIENYHFTGTFYENSNNLDDALKYYTKAIESQTAIYSVLQQADKIYRNLFHIGKIKFHKQEISAAYLALNEFCIAFTNHKEILSEFTFDRDWKYFMQDMDILFDQANIILNDINHDSIETKIAISNGFKDLIKMVEFQRLIYEATNGNITKENAEEKLKILGDALELNPINSEKRPWLIHKILSTKATLYFNSNNLQLAYENYKKLYKEISYNNSKEKNDENRDISRPDYYMYFDEFCNSDGFSQYFLNYIMCFIHSKMFVEATHFLEYIENINEDLSSDRYKYAVYSYLGRMYYEEGDYKRAQNSIISAINYGQNIKSPSNLPKQIHPLPTTEYYLGYTCSKST